VQGQASQLLAKYMVRMQHAALANAFQGLVEAASGCLLGAGGATCRLCGVEDLD